MARKTNNKIVKKHLILCEGRDAEEFLITYLNCNELLSIPEFSNEFQVMDFGGILNLSNYIGLLKNMEGFHYVESILVIRDAERNVESAIGKIKSAFRCNELSVPNGPHEWTIGSLKTGFLIFPTCNYDVCEGTLEDFCLSILKEDISSSILDDIQTFMDSLKDKYDRLYPHEFKTKLHTYFSVTDSYVSLKIGEAAKAGAFDWNHAGLLPLKEFIREVI